MPRPLLLLILGIIASSIAAIIQKQTRPRAPIRTGAAVPDHLDRADFARPEADWLVVLFSSASCLSCQGTWDKVAALESEVVAVEDVEFAAHRDRHERYGIDSVPLVVIADHTGEVRASFLGPPSAADLWASVADLREPGAVPPDCDHHGSV